MAVRIHYGPETFTVVGDYSAEQVSEWFTSVGSVAIPTTRGTVYAVMTNGVPVWVEEHEPYIPATPRVVRG